MEEVEVAVVPLEGVEEEVEVLDNVVELGSLELAAVTDAHVMPTVGS